MSGPTEPVVRVGQVALFCGDARALVEGMLITEETVLITDPVWPNSQRTSLQGREDPSGLLRDVMERLVGAGLRRAIIILGVDSDPRFLSAVPAALTFRRRIEIDSNFCAEAAENLRRAAGRPTAPEGALFGGESPPRAKRRGRR